MATAKVLHLITNLTHGGIETWLMSMLGVVPRASIEMDFCCKGWEVGSRVPEAERMGARVFHCPLGPGHVGFGRALSELLVGERYDLLHNHLELYSGFPVWLARRVAVPVVTSFHNTSFPPQMGWSRSFPLRQFRSIYGALSIRYALNRSNCITGCSRAVLDSLDRGGRRGNVAGWQVLPYGVRVPEPADSTERAHLRCRLGWPVGAPVIVHVGRFVEQKNHLGLLRIFERVVAEMPAARLLMVGDGPLRSLVEQYVRNRGLNDRVCLFGVQHDVPGLLRACDVFLFPSIHEGFGLVAIEANAASLPVVGSRVAGLTEAVQDGETALLHDVCDIEGMARSVTRILSDSALSRRLGNAGQRRARAKFSLEASAGRLLDLYARQVGKPEIVPVGSNGLQHRSKVG